MCPPYTDEDLTGLAAGDLGGVRAWKLRRHLARCATCRDELAAVQGLWARAQTHQSVPPPASLYARLVNGLPAARPKRPAAWRPLAALGAGTAALVGAALLTPGSPTRPTVAFADVERAMQAVNSVTWTDTFNIQGGLPPMPQIRQVWVRREPPTLIVSERDGGWRVWDSRGSFRYESRVSRLILVERRPAGDIAQRVARTLNYLTRRPSDADVPQIGGYVSPWQETRARFHGRLTLRFTRMTYMDLDRPPSFDAGPKGTPAKHFRRHRMITWVDARTLRILQFEDHTDGTGPHVDYIASNFRYDVRLPQVAPGPVPNVTTSSGTDAPSNR